MPKTAAGFPGLCEANPKRFTYARPVNSGPGWTFLQGLPYILGDKDPSDPMKGWDKTWAYLKELGTGIDYYPGGTRATMKELGEGTRDVIVSTLRLGHQSARARHRAEGGEVFALEGTHWVPDTQFMCIPKGVAEGQDRGPARADVLHAEARGSRPRPTTRAISIPAPP